VYEGKKAIAQRKNKRDLYKKYVTRERNGERDFVNKLVAGLSRLFPNTIHVFEDLDKEDLVFRKGLRKLGGRGTLEHHGESYIEECQRWH